MRKQNILLCALLLTACDASTQPEHKIDVEGQCLKKVTPDKAKINFNASVLRNTTSEAASEVQETYQDLVTDIKTKNLKDAEFQTSDYRIEKEILWEKESQVLKGYRATMGIEITTSDIERIGEIMAQAANFRNVEANAFQTFISSQKYKQEYEECLGIAVENAKAKAIQMAKAGDTAIGNLIYASEVRRGGPEMPYMNMAMSAPASSMMEKSQDHFAPQIEHKDQEMSVTVQAAFELK